LATTNLRKGGLCFIRLREKCSLARPLALNERYVDGQVHTNGIENFWSLLKRTLRGTYVAVEPFHLDRYLDEQIFTFNNRTTCDNPLNDGDRFMLALIADHWEAADLR
jgi:hypothetical protein